MKFIADLRDEELLPLVYNISEDIIKFVKTTNVLEIRKNLPKEGVTADEQGKKNIRDMLKVICKDYPTETAVILRKLWICEKVKKELKEPVRDENGDIVYDEFGEEKYNVKLVDYQEIEDDKPNFFVSLSKLLSSRWLIDFFISAVNLTF